MNSLQTNSPVSTPVRTAAPQAPKAPAAEIACEQDTVRVSERKHIDDKNFSWLDLGKGIAGSVVGGVIEGVGGTLAGLKDFAPITFEAEKGLWKSKMLGPVLKSTLTLPVLAAGLVSPLFTAIAGVGYGIFEGFVEGSEKNPIAAGEKAFDTCKKMHGTYTKDIVEGIRDAATKTPDKPEDVIEIKVVEGVKGLAGSLESAAIAGVGGAAATYLHLPGALVKASKEIWKSDAALPLKVGGEFLATAAAVVAVPLAPVAGVLYGLGKGAYNGYQHGVVESAKMAGNDVATYEKAISNLLKD